MAYEVPNNCPVCSSNLKITRLKCGKCGTVIENEFEQSKLASLKSEQLDFIEIFIKCRGSIKDVEKEMGISYPTVRAKLDDVVTALGYNVLKKTKKNTKDIIDMLDRGEISVDDAMKALKE